MRKPLLSLVALALVAVACSSGTTSSGGYVQPPAPPDHHQATFPPRAFEPAATPYDGTTFQDPGSNPTTDPAEDQVSTFAMDVDTASYTIAQRFVADGNLPDPASVRVEEWVNSFDQDYPAPEEGTFAVHVDGAPTPFLDQRQVLLRIGIQARDSSDRARPDAALTFVIDTSGSMAREDRLELVKDSLRKLVHGLGRGDSIAVVTFGDDARVVLPPTRATDEGKILSAIDELQPGGSTNLEAGLRLGYDLARESHVGDGIDRVILASDGVANVGLTDADGILRRIRDDAATGIELVSIGVGMGNYNDVLLEQLADQGDGFYAYVNDLAEARRLFTEDLTGTIQSVALDAKVQVEFDPAMVDSYRLVGYENRAIADQDFRDPRVDAGAVGAGHAVTALYELDLRDGFSRDDVLGTVRLRWTEPGASRESSLAREITTDDIAARFGDGAPTFKLDAVVAATAAILHGEDGPRISDLRDVVDVVREDGDLPATDQVHDFVDLLERMADLRD
jgi:Ca-activated chloride channel family protein